MPLLSPTQSDLHVNKMLTNILIGYSNQEYIADQIFPTVLVDKQTDIIPEINQDAFFRNDAGMISEGTAAPDVGYKVTKSDTFYCMPYGLRHFISDARRANEDSPFNSDREASILVTEKMLLKREISFVTDFWKTGVWGTDITGGSTTTKWSSYGTSDPITDLRNQKRVVRRLIGRDPNTLVLGDLTFDVLQDHPDFLDRIKYTGTNAQPADVTLGIIAQLFGVDKVLVGKTIYTTTNEGASTFTYTAAWDDDALLLYLPPSPSIWTPSAGYTFVWRTGLPGGADMQWVRKYRDDEILGDYIEVRTYYDQKLTVANAGAFFSDIVDDPSNV